jgi:peptide/nickel transport system ATP-binding protein
VTVESLIAIRDLHVHFRLREGLVRAVNGVSLDIPANRTLGIVGESGCGKSVTAKAIMRLLPKRAQIVQGRILLAPRPDAPPDSPPVDITALDPAGQALRRILGAEVAMVFQEPMASFSPVHTVGSQIMESIRLHRDVSRAEARQVAIDMLRRVQVPMAERRVDAYPHELSGGLRQRCMVAMALCCQPRLLIADEPTTALDVTIQAQILGLIRRLQQELSMAVLMITHDLGVIARMADEVAVMYLGRIVEKAPVAALFDEPQHPYTQGLMASIPRVVRGSRQRLYSIPGSVPDPFSVPAGCPFHPRCAQMRPGLCDSGGPPPLCEVAAGHLAACYLYAPCREAGGLPTHG